MTFEELSRSLPNGFHDVSILRLSLDSVERTATMIISVDMGSGEGVANEEYRELELEAVGVCLFFVEPPDPNYPFSLNGKGIAASGCPVETGQASPVDALLKSLPQETTAYRFFLEDWNSFLYLAASDVTLSWQP